MSAHVLVTGGLGFIGSHTSLVLLDHGYDVTIIDNLSNSFLVVLDRLHKLAGDAASRLHFKQVDLMDIKALDDVFASQRFDAVIHFAAFKAVGESVRLPIKYYENNVCGTINLIKTMQRHDCFNLVFSSSATVYGEPQRVPLDEEHPLGATNPYGHTKVFIEQMCRDHCLANPEWGAILLRYFNPVAAHPSGEIGEHPIGVPNNLMPFVQQVAVGIRPELKVFGGDYPTRDGTCVRDYIHIMDLASAHASALRKLLATPAYGCHAINVGTGTGTTVLEMVRAFEEACGKPIPYTIVARREGDVVANWAATTLAEEELGWKAQYNITDMCRDQWNWASKHPKGYEP